MSECFSLICGNTSNLMLKASCKSNRESTNIDFMDWNDLRLKGNKVEVKGEQSAYLVFTESKAVS